MQVLYNFSVHIACWHFSIKMKKSYSGVNIVLAYINLLLKILLLLTTKKNFAVVNERSKGRASRGTWAFMYMRRLSEWPPNSLGVPSLHPVGKENVSTEELAANQHTVVLEFQVPWSWNLIGSYTCSCSHGLKYSILWYSV